MTDLNKVVELLSLIEEDASVPRSVRVKMKTAITSLQNPNGKPPEVIFDKILQELDELSNDPHIPQFTRTQIWSVVSALESK